jgi:hypothetical protein
MTARIFVSYAREDTGFTLQLAGDMKQQGLPVWVDQWNIPPGTKWPKEIEKAMQECSHFLIVLSPASVASDEVDNELQYAVSADKVILPVLYQACQVPLRIHAVQYIDFANLPYPDGVQRLLKVFKSEEIQTPDPQLSLGQIIPGSWVTYFSQQTPWGPNVGQINITLWPNGAYQFQTVGYPIITGQGQWALISPVEIELRGFTSNGFQTAPYWTRVQFNQVTPNQLHGYTGAWEQVQWQRMG